MTFKLSIGTVKLEVAPGNHRQAHGELRRQQTHIGARIVVGDLQTSSLILTVTAR